MPPKAKFTRKEIVDAALAIVRESGAERLTARALGNKLGSSACPIFTVFENMEEVGREVAASARRLYGDYVAAGLAQTEMPAFKGVGSQYVAFAVREPKLFQLLFMSEKRNKTVVSDVLPEIDENYERILASVRDSYGLNDEDALRLYRHLWIYTHGVAVLFATDMCAFRAEEVGGMMTDVCTALIKKIKEEKGV